MKFDNRWMLALLVAACLPLASCKKMEAEAEEGDDKANRGIKRTNIRTNRLLSR
jgi:hypothetical protein